MSNPEEIEIGYVCRKGHFQFNDDPDGDTCGTKRIAGIYVRADEAVNLSQSRLAEVVAESMDGLRDQIEAWARET